MNHNFTTSTFELYRNTCLFLHSFSALFVDVGNNYSVLDHPNICFIYEYVGSKDSDRDQSFVSHLIFYM
jgi:hypothetical protein